MLANSRFTILSLIHCTLRGGITMSSLLALSVSIGGLGAVATWLALVAGVPGMQIWGVFIGWGCYFASGANTEALKGAICGHISGAVLAVVALNLVGLLPIAGALEIPIWVGVTVAALVYASTYTPLANIPAAVYGYATTAALFLLGGMDTIGLSLFNAVGELNNPGVVAVISLIIGAVFGALSGRLAGMLGSD